MLGARPEPLNLSLLSQLPLALAPSAPPARAGSCLGAKHNRQSWPGVDWRLQAIEMSKRTFVLHTVVAALASR